MTPTPTLSEMLDLPKEERSRYLRAFPTTRTYVFGCLETAGIRHIRRVITRHGGVYREVYRYPGVFWVATYRTHGGMLQATRELCLWQNVEIVKSAELHGHLSHDEIVEMLYDPATWGTEHTDIPALRFERDVWISGGPESRRIDHGFHPIVG